MRLATPQGIHGVSIDHIRSFINEANINPPLNSGRKDNWVVKNHCLSYNVLWTSPWKGLILNYYSDSQQLVFQGKNAYAAHEAFMASLVAWDQTEPPTEETLRQQGQVIADKHVTNPQPPPNMGPAFSSDEQGDGPMSSPTKRKSCTHSATAGMQQAEDSAAKRAATAQPNPNSSPAPAPGTSEPAEGAAKHTHNHNLRKGKALSAKLAAAKLAADGPQRTPKRLLRNSGKTPPHNKHKSKHGSTVGKKKTRPADVYEVENIISHKTENEEDFFHVSWVGYSQDDNTWEPYENLKGSPLLLNAYITEHMTLESIKDHTLTGGELLLHCHWEQLPHSPHWLPEADLHTQAQLTLASAYKLNRPQLEEANEEPHDADDLTVISEPSAPPASDPGLTEATGALTPENGTHPLPLPFSEATPGSLLGADILKHIFSAEPCFDNLTWLPQSNEDIVEYLTQAALNIHLTASPIKRLPTTTHWEDSLRTIWTSARDAFADHWGAFIDAFIADYDSDKTALDLLNATLAMYALPGIALVQHSNLKPFTGRVEYTLEEGGTKLYTMIGDPANTFKPREQHKKPPNSAPTPDQLAHLVGGQQKATLVAKLVRKDKNKQATKVLFSNGAAPRDSKALPRLKKMYHSPPEPLTPHEQSVGKIKVKASQTEKIMRAKAGNKESPVGVFGWSACMFIDDRGRKRNNGKLTLLQQAARFTAMLASADLPLAIAYLGNCCQLTELNKINELEQQALIDSGLDRKTRCISAGSELTKVSMAAAKCSPQVAAFTRTLQPIQTACGTKNGPSIMAYTVAALHKSAHNVVLDDRKDAFPSLHRQAILDEVEKHIPAATSLINLSYALPSPVFFLIRESGKWVAHILWSEEGLRQGSVWGNLLYCTTIKSKLDTLASKFPNVVIKAQVDDITKSFGPPHDGDWHKHWRMIRDFLTLEDELFTQIGQHRHPDKCYLVLAPGAPDPGTLFDINGIKRKVVTGGVSSGIPFGADSYVRAFINDKARQEANKLLSITTLVEHEPHVAMLIASKCIKSSMAYHWGGVPPRLCQEAYSILDAAAQQLREAILNPENSVAPDCCTERKQLAHDLLCLPNKMGGADHTRAAQLGPAHYMSKLMSVAKDPYLLSSRALFAEEAEFAYKHLMDTLGIDKVRQGTPLAKSLPSSHIELIEGPFAVRTTKTHSRGIIGAVNSAIGLHNFRKIRTEIHAEVSYLSKADKTHIGAILLRSQTSRIFATSLWHKQNRFYGPDFVAFLRYYCNLPRTLSAGVPLMNDKGECIGERCLIPHKKGAQNFTPTLDHVASCISAKGAIYRLHGLIIAALIDAAKAAGLIGISEPPTARLLGWEYTSSQLRTMFPKGANAAEKRKGAQLQTLLKALETTIDPAERIALFAKCQHIIDDAPDNAKGLRVDGAIFGCNGEELWLDASGTHTTQTSKLNTSAKFFTELHDAEVLARTKGKLNVFTARPSPAIRARESIKYKTYNPVVRLAEVQAHKGMRKRAPVFRPCVVSHTGEFSPGCVSTIEWITAQYRAILRKSPPHDGRPVAHYVASFRSTLKDWLASANAKGFGRAIRLAGSHHIAAALPLAACVHLI
jgi:hypothetical protein